MVKFIGNWMFASHVWNDVGPTPVAISLQEVELIDQINAPQLGGDCVVVHLKHSENPIPIEGNIIEVLAEFQKHLQTIY
jgi:hypothetical protein